MISDSETTVISAAARPGVSRNASRSRRSITGGVSCNRPVKRSQAPALPRAVSWSCCQTSLRYTLGSNRSPAAHRWPRGGGCLQTRPPARGRRCATGCRAGSSRPPPPTDRRSRTTRAAVAIERADVHLGHDAPYGVLQAAGQVRDGREGFVRGGFDLAAPRRHTWGHTAVAPVARSMAASWPSRTSPHSTSRPVCRRRPSAMSALCTCPTSSNIGTGSGRGVPGTGGTAAAASERHSTGASPRFTSDTACRRELRCVPRWRDHHGQQPRASAGRVAPPGVEEEWRPAWRSVAAQASPRPLIQAVCAVSRIGPDRRYWGTTS